MTPVTTATHTITAHYEVGNTCYDLDLTTDTLEDNVQEALEYFNEAPKGMTRADFEVTEHDTDEECGTVTIEGRVTPKFWGDDNGGEDHYDDQITVIIEWAEK